MRTFATSSSTCARVMMSGGLSTIDCPTARMIRLLFRAQVAAFVGGVVFGREDRALGFVLDQLQPCEQPDAAQLTDDRMLIGELLQPRTEIRRDVLAHALDQTLALDQLDVRDGNGTRGRMTRIRVAVREQHRLP